MINKEFQVIDYDQITEDDLEKCVGLYCLYDKITAKPENVFQTDNSLSACRLIVATWKKSVFSIKDYSLMHLGYFSPLAKIFAFKQPIEIEITDEMIERFSNG